MIGGPKGVINAMIAMFVYTNNPDLWIVCIGWLRFVSYPDARVLAD